MTVEFQFEIGQAVNVVAISTIGFVDGMILDKDGPQYRVVYWHNGTRSAVWMYPREIEARNTTAAIGFGRPSNTEKS